MRKFANSNKVNYGIGLALFGILVFSLMVPVEGFTAPPKTTKSKTVKEEEEETSKPTTMQTKKKTVEGMKKKTSERV